MAAHALRRVRLQPDPATERGNRQLALSEQWMAEARRAAGTRPAAPVCAACREREARYGFRDAGDPAAERPRTLCFACFRVEVARRQAVAARVARGWNAQQRPLPLEQTLETLSRRRRRAQMAARHAIGA